MHPIVTLQTRDIIGEPTPLVLLWVKIPRKHWCFGRMFLLVTVSSDASIGTSN